MIVSLRKIASCSLLLFATVTLIVRQAASQEQQPQPSPTVPAGAVETGVSAAEATPPDLPPTRDPKEIIRRAIAADEANFKQERNYTYLSRQVFRTGDGHGNFKAPEIKTYDIAVYYGEPFERLVEKDDKPLTEKEQKKEDEKLDKFLAKRKNESAEDRSKRLAKEEKEREKERAFSKDAMNAYDFRLLEDEQIDGRNMYVIEGIPRKDFHPTQPHADMLSKIKGKVWIDQKDYGLAKLEIEVVDTISFGVFLARLHKGSEVHVEQTRVNNEVWLMKKLLVNASARLLLFKNETFGLESTYSNYKKFVSTVRIGTEVREVPSEPPQK